MVLAHQGTAAGPFSHPAGIAGVSECPGETLALWLGIAVRDPHVSHIFLCALFLLPLGIFSCKDLMDK